MGATRENLTRAEARRRADLLRDVRYDVSLDLTQGDELFGVEATISFEASEDQAATFIDCTADDLHTVSLNDSTLDPGVVEETRIALPGLRAGRNELQIAATMAYQHEGRGLHFFRDPSDDCVYLHSQFEPFDAHLVYPCFDQPDLKATFDLAVTAPAEWVVISNGKVTSRPADGEAGRWEFATTPRIPPYITAVVAGAYHHVGDRHGDVDLGLYIRRSLAEHLDADELFELTARGLDWFAEIFDMAYPFGKYDQLFVPEFSAGAMENPGCVTFSEAHIFRSKVTDAARERRAETLLHEMAHMWFGDLVTMRWWDDLWLNESFATFMATLGQVNATRFQDAWVTFLDSEKAWATYQDQLPTTHPIAADLADVEAVHQNFDGITYAKGASVLRQLVAWVGQEAFLEGCRRYFQKHAWNNAELRDFLAALEEASGRELGPWEKEWLTTTGINTLTPEYSIDSDGRFTSFAIHQSAPDDHPTLRRHRLAVGIYDVDDGALSRIERVELDVSGERTDVPELVGRPSGRMVLVNDDDLTYAKLRLPERDMAVATDHLGAVDEALPRALVWSAAWDMIRDAEASARTYVDLVTTNIGAETEIGVLQRLLRRALAAAKRYGSPAARPERLRDIAGVCRTALEGAPPGSDRQLVLARTWASAAREDAEMKDIRRLLEGELDIPGLEVDTELRWHLVTSLATAGGAGETLIAAELERDPTDLGQRHAATARAARPDRAAKEEAFSRLIEDTELSHTMSRQLWSGIQQLDQPEVLAGFDDRYFEALDEVWETRSLDWAIEFTVGMFPHALASDGLRAQVDDHLERDDLVWPRRRALLEQRDLLERTLRARQVDAADG